MQGRAGGELEVRTCRRCSAHHTQGSDEQVVDSIDEHIDWLDQQLDKLDEGIGSHIATREELCELNQRLQQVPGVGPITCLTLLVYLPELGELNRKQIAATTSLAPSSAVRITLSPAIEAPACATSRALPLRTGGSDSSEVSRTLRSVHAWCKTHRHLPIAEQQQKLTQKLRGHYNYFGISGNMRSLSVAGAQRAR